MSDFKEWRLKHKYAFPPYGEGDMEEAFNAGRAQGRREGMEEAADMVDAVSDESAKEGFEGFAHRVSVISRAIRKAIKQDDTHSASETSTDTEPSSDQQ